MLPLVLSIFLAAQDVPEIARNLMEGADRARAANHLDEAAEKYQRAIVAAPQLAAAYINLGAIYYRQNKVAEAYEVFTRGASRAPVDKILLMNAAAAGQQLGKSAEALTYVDRALAMNPRDADLHALRATILRSLDRTDDALAAVEQAARLAPDDARVHFSRGNLLYQLGRKDDAAAAFKRATDLDRTLQRAWYNLGATLFETGRYDDALKAYRMALQPIDQALARGEAVDVIHARAFENLGAIYLKQQKWSDAIAAYEKALRLDANSTTAHYNLGYLYFTTGKNDRAEAEYRKALAADASLPLAYLHLADIALRAAKYDDAIQLVRDGLPRFDDATKRMATRTLARAQLAKGDRAAARDSFEAAGDTRMATFQRVLIARDAGNLDAERAAIEALLAREKPRPELAPLRAELAVVMLKQNALADARKQLDAIGFRQLAPLVAAVMDANEGKRDAAARALAQLPSPVARGDAGILFWQLGRAAEAKPHLAAALKADPDWQEVALAAGEIAVAEKRYNDAVDLLAPLKCDSAICTRARQLVTYARAALAPAEPEPTAQPEPTAPDPRRTVVVFLPDDQKLAESMSGTLNNLGAGLQPELFRRADDARGFIAANRDHIGMVISNEEFIVAGFIPRYRFSRDGRQTYRRVVVVPAHSSAKSLADLRGKTISAVDALGDPGVGVTTRVPDDLTAAANALYGKTDAALVSEANPLLTKELRVVHTTPPTPMPVIAFAPMPDSERTTLDAAFRPMSTLARLTGPPPPRREPLPSRPPGEPPVLTLRMAIEVPRIEIPENLFGE